MVSKYTRDIFICHASEDKETVVRPIVEAFIEAGISCWYDEAEIKWGDSITQKVNEGLRISQYVIVVLSSAFLEKNWPQRELNATLNIESSSGEIKVLPLLVGSAHEKENIIEKIPLLADKRYLPWDGEIRKIIEAVQNRLGKHSGVQSTLSNHASGYSTSIRIPLPKIKKIFSQRDKDIFLRNAFTVLKEYFIKALAELAQHYEEVETDFSEIHNLKFLCTIYLRGAVANRCKIWIGGLSYTDSIAYNDGQTSIDSDNSFNDMLSVGSNEISLGFNPSHFRVGMNDNFNQGFLTAERAAEYLWKRFTKNLG